MPAPRASASPPVGDHHHDVGLRRSHLLAIGALLALVLIAVGVVRLTGATPSSASQAPVVSERLLHFVDRPDGSIEVREATAAPDAAPLSIVDAGSNGFLRGALRSLVRERRQHGLGAEAPFHLVARRDGRLSLDDPATGRRLDLESFGPTNAGVFAQILAAQPASAAAH